MKNKKELYEDALVMARENIPPLKNHLDISIEKGTVLAKEYNADVDLVLIGILLMDIKLGEAIKMNRGSEHTKMSSDFAKKFLEDYDLTNKEKDILINSIEAHHGNVPYESIEAEVCANADCYRFLHPLGIFTYADFLAKKDIPFINQIKELQFKMDEKYNTLSLDKAKEELLEYYEIYSKHFDEILKQVEK